MNVGIDTLYYIRTQILTHTFPARASRCTANLSCLAEYAPGIRHVVELIDTLIKREEESYE